MSPNRIREAAGFWPFICRVVPDLANATHVTRTSTSAGLYNTETERDIEGSSGLHAYVLIADAADIPRFLENLHKRLWLAGGGWHRIGKAGQLLDAQSGRSLCIGPGTAGVRGSAHP